MKKVMVVFGTRPEAIKMCPLVKELKKRNSIKTILCTTGQHKEMLNQVLEKFNLKPDYNLEIMKNNQTLFDITVNILNKMKNVLEKEKPDIVLVHGDTTTTFATAISAFYMKIKIGHVEAGLRTYDMYMPYPEEFNREAVSLIANYHFAPTENSKNNLLKEGKKEETIFVTGNTAIDALKSTVNKNYESRILDWVGNDRMILLTAHRRENQGKPLINIFDGIKRIVENTKDVKIVFPVHKNPKIKKVAQKILGNMDRIMLIDALDVFDFHNLMARAYLILTDSGGIQEEAPSFGKPVLVLRDTTERPEGIKAGTLKLVGTDSNKIYEETKMLLEDKEYYKKMSNCTNPYGDGFASQRIADILINMLNE